MGTGGTFITAKGMIPSASAAGVLTGVAVGSAGQIFVADPNATSGLAWEAEESLLLAPSGAIAETYPRRGATLGNSTALTTATLQLIAMPIRSGKVVTAANIWQATTAFTAAANQWLALYDSSLNCIRQSTDQLTTGTGANTKFTGTLDSVPVTAGARVASTTVTLTIPTLNQALSALFAVSDSIVVSNANIAAYNGTFTVTGVTATTITYTAGSSATDNLSAPFPTVQMAAGKRTYTVPTTALYYVGAMFKGTVGTHESIAPNKNNVIGAAPILNGTSTGSLTGTAPSPAAAITVASVTPYLWLT